MDENNILGGIGATDIGTVDIGGGEIIGGEVIGGDTTNNPNQCDIYKSDNHESTSITITGSSVSLSFDIFYYNGALYTNPSIKCDSAALYKVVSGIEQEVHITDLYSDNVTHSSNTWNNNAFSYTFEADETTTWKIKSVFKIYSGSEWRQDVKRTTTITQSIPDITDIDITGLPIIYPQTTENYNASTTPSDPNEKLLSWSVSDDSVLEITTPHFGSYRDVSVKSLKIGDASLICSTSRGPGVQDIVAEKFIRSLIPVINISLSGVNDLNVGDQANITATINPDYATHKELAWSVTPSDVVNLTDTDASINKITAVGGGTATITATATDGSGVSGSRNVTVIGGSLRVDDVSVGSRITSSETVVYFPQSIQQVTITPAEQYTDISVIQQFEDEWLDGLNITITDTNNSKTEDRVWTFTLSSTGCAPCTLTVRQCHMVPILYKINQGDASIYLDETLSPNLTVTRKWEDQSTDTISARIKTDSLDTSYLLYDATRNILQPLKAGNATVTLSPRNSNYQITAGCISCGACDNTCPISAITNTGTEIARQINSNCNSCGACDNICPQEAIEYDISTESYYGTFNVEILALKTFTVTSPDTYDWHEHQDASFGFTTSDESTPVVTIQRGSPAILTDPHQESGKNKIVYSLTKTNRYEPQPLRSETITLKANHFESKNVTIKQESIKITHYSTDQQSPISFYVDSSVLLNRTVKINYEDGTSAYKQPYYADVSLNAGSHLLFSDGYLSSDGTPTGVGGETIYYKYDSSTFEQKIVNVLPLKEFTITQPDDLIYSSQNIDIQWTCEDNVPPTTQTSIIYSDNQFLHSVTSSATGIQKQGHITGTVDNWNAYTHSERSATITLKADHYRDASVTVKQHSIRITEGPSLMQRNLTTITKDAETDPIDFRVKYVWEDSNITYIDKPYSYINSYDEEHLSYISTRNTFKGIKNTGSSYANVEIIFNDVKTHLQKSLYFYIAVTEKKTFDVSTNVNFNYIPGHRTIPYLCPSSSTKPTVNVEISDPDRFIQSAGDITALVNPPYGIDVSLGGNNQYVVHGQGTMSKIKSGKIILKASDYENSEIFINQYAIQEISITSAQENIYDIYEGVTYPTPLDPAIYATYEDDPDRSVRVATGTFQIIGPTQHVSILTDNTIRGISAGTQSINILDPSTNNSIVKTFSVTVLNKKSINIPNVTAINYTGSGPDGKQTWDVSYTADGEPSLNIISYPSWIEAIPKTNKKLQLTINPNNSSSLREGDIVIGAGDTYNPTTMHIVQWGNKPTAQIEAPLTPGTVNGFYPNDPQYGYVSKGFKLSDGGTWIVNTYASADPTSTTESEYVSGSDEGYGSTYKYVEFKATETYSGEPFESSIPSYARIKSLIKYNDVSTGVYIDANGNTPSAETIASLTGYATAVWEIDRYDWDTRALSTVVSWDSAGKRLNDYSIHVITGTITNTGAKINISYGLKDISVPVKKDAATSTPTISIQSNSVDASCIEGPESLDDGTAQEKSGTFKFRFAQNDTSGLARVYVPYITVETVTATPQTTDILYGNINNPAVYNESASGCIVQPSYLDETVQRPLINETDTKKVYTCESATSGGKFIYQKHDCTLITNSMVPTEDRWRCLDTRVEVKQ